MTDQGDRAAGPSTGEPASASIGSTGESGARSRLGHWPLRRRLVLLVAGLLVMVTVIIGGASVLVLRHTLSERMDDELSVSLRTTGFLDAGVDEEADGAAHLSGAGTPDAGLDERGGASEMRGGRPGPRLGSLQAIALPDGRAGGLLVDEEGTQRELSTEQLQAVVEVDDGQPTTVDLGDLGRYRVLVGSTTTGALVAVGQSLGEVDRTTRDLSLIFGLVGVVALGLGVLVSRRLIRTGLRPLDRLAETATGVAAVPLASGEVDLPQRVPPESTVSGTEVGEVGSAFNRMLDHVEGSLRQRHRSEERLRRFSADASHELRTPLAAVSGYAQMARRHEAELPADVDTSLQRIEAAAGRMGALVEDLLLLARLDAGSALVEQEVEIAGVLVEALADAQAAAPEHVWDIDLPEDAGDLRVVGDPRRLHQAVLNVLANAGKHTPAGTRVLASLSSADDRVRLVIADDGPGIPEELTETLFDRFSRGDVARGSAQGSTGLGLAIVQAIMQAHGGEARVVPAESGTTILLDLPAG